MMLLIMFISYLLLSYGITMGFIYFNGPFDILEKIRRLANWIHPKVGELFTCVFCFSTWVGGLLSLINYLWIPVPLTPFNVILGTTGMWWFILPMDAFLTCGSIWLLHLVDEYLEKNSKEYED